MAIINTPEDLHRYLPAPYNNKLELLPDFSAAEEQFLIPVIGTELFNALQASNLSTNLQQLLDKCRAVIAPFGYLNHLEFLQVQLSDNGLIAVEAENMRKAYKWEYNNVKEALTNMGYSRQELLILFLQERKADFPQWQSSPYNKSAFPIIRNGFTLSEAISIAQPHRSYMALKPILTEVGELTLESALGPEYYQDLCNRMLSGQETDDEKLFMRSLRMAAARFAMATAARTMNVRYSAASGFTIAESAKDTAEEGRRSASAYDLSLMMREMELSAKAFLDKVTKALDDKASESVFPVYYHSSKYTNPHVSSAKLRTDRNGMFCTS